MGVTGEIYEGDRCTNMVGAELMGARSIFWCGDCRE